MAKFTRETTKYPDGTIKTKETYKESSIEAAGNTFSKVLDNGIKSITGKPIDNTPRLPGS